MYWLHTAGVFNLPPSPLNVYKFSELRMWHIPIIIRELTFFYIPSSNGIKTHPQYNLFVPCFLAVGLVLERVSLVLNIAVSPVETKRPCRSFQSASCKMVPTLHFCIFKSHVTSVEGFFVAKILYWLPVRKYLKECLELE